MRTPLAWKNLTHDKRRLAVALAGVNFAVLLIFMEIGFQNALLDSTVQVLRDLKADIVIVSKATYALPVRRTFDLQRVYQARGCPGVEGAYPLYIETYSSLWTRPGKKGAWIRVLGFNLDDPVLKLRIIHGKYEDLRQPGVAMIDSKSKQQYGAPASDAELVEMQIKGAELNKQSVRLVGTFALGTDFTNDGNLIMSADNLARYFPYRAKKGDPKNSVDLGLVQIEPGRSADEVAAELAKLLPDDVTVYTKEALVRNEMRFWSNSTPIGYIFSVGAVMGFIVGVIICYQIIHADISDHMPEFATLKAMGYSNGFFVGLVLQQAVFLSLLGFLPGVIIASALYAVMAQYTGLLMYLTIPRALLVLGLTLTMCITSGVLAIRKLVSTDPAELF